MTIEDNKACNFTPKAVAISLCQAGVEQLSYVFSDDKEGLSQNLCALIGETYKVLAPNGDAHSSSISELYESCLGKGQIQHNEKLILDSMRSYKSSLIGDDLMQTLSYISDIELCLVTINNVAHMLQLSGEFNTAYELIGRTVIRFENEAPDELHEIDSYGSLFFSDWNINLTRHGFHDFAGLPKRCRPKDQGPLTSPLSDLSGYFFAIYGNNEALKSALSRNSKYQSILLNDALIRELDADFLRPIINECVSVSKNVSILHSFSTLTHLEWGGEHLSLLRPWLKNQKDIDDVFLADTTLACWQMQLAAHVGELDFALQINQKAFAYSEHNDFDTDNADYFYEACVSCGFYDEANEWLYYGNPDEWDLPAKLYNAVDFRCSRGESLKEAELFAEPREIDYELIAGKWLNGFDVEQDVKFLLNSNKASTLNKICSLRYLICGPTPFVNRHNLISVSSKTENEKC